MRRLAISRFGGPEVLEWQEVPDPTPAPGELLVRTTAFAVMWADLLEREGRYPGMGEPPLPAGHDLAGVVAAHGEGVDGPPLGTRVFGIRPMSGSAAELVTVRADWVYPTPEQLGDAEA
ncbi:MAG: alcohol dehydrogenase catalytic domain-containing protein, partial [Acidimicrobiia bacterium]